MDNESCIICLDNNPETITYKGVCECHPRIHTECINTWYQTNPETCPICLNKYQISIRNFRNWKRYLCLYLSILGCICVFCGPFLLISILVIMSIYSK
jgi:hypothetical protein